MAKTNVIQAIAQIHNAAQRQRLVAARDKYSLDEAIEGMSTVPEDLSPEQAEVYRKLIASAQMKDSGFDEAAAEIIARNPTMAQQYLEQLRKRTVERVAAHLSECKELVDLPLDTIKTMLSLPMEDSMHYVYAITEISKAKLDLTQEEIKETVDLARVIHVMEEEDRDKIKDDRTVVGQAPLKINPSQLDEEFKDLEPAPDHTIRTIWARQARSRLKTHSPH